MYIKRIKLAGVRGFSDARRVELDLTRPDGTYAGMTVLAGRNGAGKTSLLRAVALALTGPDVARSLVTTFEDWITDGHTTGKIEVEVLVNAGEDLFLSDNGTVQALWLGLEWERMNAAKGNATRRTVQPALREALNRNRRSKRAAYDGPWADNPTGWFSAGYGPFRRLAGGAASIQRLMLGPTPVARHVTLFHEDASLAESVTWLVDQHLRSLEERPGAEALLEAVQAILGDGLLPDGFVISKVNADGLWVTQGTQSMALREMSDGFRTVAALTLDILHQLHEGYGRLPLVSTEGSVYVDLPGVVLVDELDVHLHVSWQKFLGGWLKRHFPRVQFIVTTHSPYVCQSADARGLIRLAGPIEQRGPEILSDDMYERVVLGGGDDAVISDLFGLDTPYSSRAEQLQRELERLEDAVTEGSATEDVLARYHMLAEQLARPLLSRVEDVVTARRSARS